MKSNLLHICFVIDESGSMYSSIDDVKGGFQRLVDEQKQVEHGKCLISVYRFSDSVESDFIGKPVNEVESINYSPGGCTAMNDGIGTAIDEIGKWLSEMDESERPSKNLVVIMTDGMENFSKKYTLKDVKERIKHQEDKYNWSFIYMGTDIASLDDANTLGISLSSISSRGNIANNYSHISGFATSYRNSNNTKDITCAYATLSRSLDTDTIRYVNDNKS